MHPPACVSHGEIQHSHYVHVVVPFLEDILMT